MARRRGALVTAPSCAEVQSQLDERLDAAATVRFHAHLETCASCRHSVTLWRSLTPRLREAAPAPPDAMAIRRMQLEIERQLKEPSPLDRPARVTPTLLARSRGRRRIALGSIMTVALAAALLALWVRPARRSGQGAPVAYAGLTLERGAVTLAGRPIDQGGTARVSVEAPLALAVGASVQLALDRGATVQVVGPARLTLSGTAAEVAIRLDEGQVQAQVSHRGPNETFAVITRDARVEVRGTRFTVTATARGSHVEVTEGRVAVRFSDGRNVLVPAGKSVDSAVTPDDATASPAPPGEVAPPPSPPSSAPSSIPALACVDAVHACRATAQTVRDSMRSGDVLRALRVVGDGDREARAAAERCGTMGACRDELGYLHAEALSQSGRAGDAVAAFRALDRRGAPAAMRQNALYAAAQIERQRGWAARARADYERALAAAPRGTLAEDALAGAMESAHGAGDEARARTLAARYLRSFPQGLAAASARTLLGGAAP